MTFTHLRVYSEYSLLQSACRIRPLVKRAKELGFKALALTDKNVMYGTIPFYKTCLEFGVKPIIGLEAQVATGAREDEKSYPLILLAKNKRGYQNLLKISSHIQMQREVKKQAIAVRTLKKYSAHIVALSAGLDGEIGQCLLHGEFEQAHHLAKLFKNVFNDGHFFLEIENHGLAAEKTVNEQLIKLKEKTALSFVVTNNVHYIHKNDALAYEALVAIKQGTEMAPVKNDQFYLKSAEEMFSAIPKPFQQAVRQSTNIAQMCNLELTFGTPMLPKYPLPRRISSREALRKLCKQGVAFRYGKATAEIDERLHYELSVIDKMGFNDYFLIVWDFMKFARDNGIITGPGRGSAAGSLVAYVLYITNVDPLKHELLFERFLNPERVSLPDIDIDFPDTRRDEVIAYVGRKYGTEHVAHIITFGTLAARAAVRDVGRLLGVAPKVVDDVAKQIPSRPGITLDQALQESPQLQQQIKHSKEVKRLLTLARSIEGFPRHSSTHAAGIIISREPLTDVVALKSGHENIALTQFPMEDLEEIGLLKIDFLGLRNLALIEAVLKNIEKHSENKLVLEDIPLFDEKTFALLSKGDTTGVFQLESQGMRQVLRQLKPNGFEDIVAVNALYRPGPMDNIPTYIAAKHGKRKVTYPHPDLVPILQKTYGVIVYQEQIMQIASLMAGFSLGEADLLRRAIAKKKRTILERERDHFITGCLENGYSKETAHYVYKLLVRFADYGFNRSHAVAYSVIAYQLAYLKANFPVAFFTALLTSVIGNDTKLSAYISELKQRKIAILPPSINQSDMIFKNENGAIRYGLLAVKNVGLQALKEIIGERRKNGAYKSLFNLCRRISLKVVQKRTLEALIFAGACDEFNSNRASLLATLDQAIDIGAADDQIELFDDAFKTPDYVQVPPFSEREKLAYEKEALGFYLSGHPVERFRHVLKHYPISVIAALKTAAKNETIRTAVMIEHVRTIQTKKGEPMAFLRVSDQTGEAEVIVFPNMYRRVKALLQVEEGVYVEGHVDKRAGNDLKLIANQMLRLNELKGEKKIYLKLNKARQNTETLALIKRVLLTFPGKTKVVLYYEAEKQARHLSQQFSVSASHDCLRELAAILGKENITIR